MKTYVINREHLNSKLKRFYESRYEKLKKENKVLRKDDIMKHFRDMVKFINADVVDETLNQPVFDEWIDKGYKQFKHKETIAQSLTPLFLFLRVVFALLEVVCICCDMLPLSPSLVRIPHKGENFLPIWSFRAQEVVAYV